MLGNDTAKCSIIDIGLLFKRKLEVCKKPESKIMQ
jgi:hypothetical protein